MLKIAVVGGAETVMGFKALGLEACPVANAEEARETLRRLTKDSEDYAIIYVEENLAQELQHEIDKFKDVPKPAIILIPGRGRPLGLGQTALKAAVERAVGSDIALRKGRMKLSGTITKVSGPLVVANGLADANVSDVVRVGEQRLIGEILNMTGDSASIQVYEETSGLGPGAKVETTGMPLSVELGPGMLENIYDGIQRPLPEIRDLTGSNITRGVEVPALNRERVWHFDPVVQPGTAVIGGDVIGTVQETTAILHKIMVPPQMKGTIKEHHRRRLHGRPDRRRAHRRQRRRPRAEHDPALAGAYRASLRAEVCPEQAHEQRPAYHRHALPDRQRAARPPCPARSAAARPSCSTSSPSGRTWTSSSTLAAANAATR